MLSWTLTTTAMTQAAPRHSYTFRDYLDVEELSVVRHEFIDGEIIAMAGGTPEHAALASAIYVLLSQEVPKIELWSRANASSAWSYTAYGPGDVVDLRSIGCRLDVNEVYAVAGVAKP